MPYLKINVFCKEYATNTIAFVYYEKDENKNIYFFSNDCENYHSSALCTECHKMLLNKAHELLLTDPDNLTLK